MEYNSKNIGYFSESMITTAFLKAGLKLSKPIYDNLRYDLIIDVDNKLYRIQCKTASLKDGYLIIPTASRSGCLKHKRRTYFDEIEYFAIASPELNKIFIL